MRSISTLRIACEIPRDSVGFMAYNDYEFIIAPELQHQPYMSMYKWENKYKIVDNGVFEGKFLEQGEYLRLAKEVDADEIVAQDHLTNVELSLSRTYLFVDSLSKEEKKRFKIMGVVHGKTYKEVRDSYNYLIAIKDISVIGFAKNIGSSQRQRYFVKLLLDGHLKLFKQYHFLGLNLWSDLQMYMVRSIDTTLPIKAALCDCRLWADDTANPIVIGKIARPPDYFTRRLTHKQNQVARTNMSYIRTVCRDAMVGRNQGYNIHTVR